MAATNSNPHKPISLTVKAAISTRQAAPAASMIIKYILLLLSPVCGIGG